jgi:hypothetical protein
MFKKKYRGRLKRKEGNSKRRNVYKTREGSNK